ncbi:membrane protein [Mesobacillus campisalis]|uniref:Membrane protein n=1 Tax=Mesobacillus campisalis TaxID=1408103 RepID=A0A0M2SUK8_9BACI|nr:cytochrome c oxidase assembly protein [Mesobacillus campisalis]KKK37376.1 membrane protein [Mesobacillus campisalis]
MNNHASWFLVWKQGMALGAFLALAGYLWAVWAANRKHNKWPLYRSLFWMAGILCAAAAVTGPLAEMAHTDFAVHMLGHLLLGMLAPLLLVLSAPMTLLMRALDVKNARRLSAFLKGRYVRVIGDPFVAAVMNIGGLWLLYTTSLYEMMHHHPGLHALVHIHVFFAGYLFSAAMIYIDPVPHRRPFLYRGIIFVLALAGHGILSKYIYANPPDGVDPVQAETGAMLMYYGGDAVDLGLIILFCWQWYYSARPRRMVASSQQSGLM